MRIDRTSDSGQSAIRNPQSAIPSAIRNPKSEIPVSEPEAGSPRTMKEAVAKLQRLAQAYGYTPQEQEGLTTICRAYYTRLLRGLVASRGQRRYAVRIATFARSRYPQAQQIAAVLDAAGLPAEIAPCQDGKVLVGVYVGPASYEATKGINREQPETVVVPYEAVNRARAALGSEEWVGAEPLGQPPAGAVPPGQPGRGGASGPAPARLSHFIPHPPPALADYVPTHIEWKDWWVASSENLYAGCIHTRYPLTHLLDGDPRTAWVFSGTGQCRDGWRSRQALALAPREPTVIDSLWLMNGYNKSRELFLRNNRVVQIRLSVNGKTLKTATLSDKMGWHKVSLPRQAVRHLQIEFTGLRRGRDDDLCLSELALYNNGRQIDMHMPSAVMFSEGGRRGGSHRALVSHRGEIIARDDVGEGGMVAWSPNGRYVASVETVRPTGDRNPQSAIRNPQSAIRRGRPQLWVADVTTGRVIYRQTLPRTEIAGLQWKDHRTVEVTFQAAGESHKEVFTEVLRDGE
jgi:hypothetical protein